MRKALLGLLTAALVGLPAIPASATMEHCPEGVSAVRGTSPSWTQVNAWLEASASAHDVPAAVLKAIALRESEWEQFVGVNGPVVVSSDGVCGLGIMQITADDRADAVELAQNAQYNIDEGAKILRAKWDLSQQTAPPDTYAADDDDVIENWYYAICLYNGCGSDDTYVRQVAGMVHDPFRRVPWWLWKFMRPAGLTIPVDVDATYVFPSAFQARHTPEGGEFVFYDHTNGDVSKVVPAITHRASAPPVISYPARTVGPDLPAPGSLEVACGVCGGWRLAEGTGIAGRAHWTNTVTTAAQSSVTWYNWEPGRFRVSAYVPPLGATTLGKATYRIRPTGDDTKHFTVPVVDQNARKGGWVSLGDWTMDGAAKVYLDDHSSVGGQPIVADAVRFTPVTQLRIEPWVKSAPNTYHWATEVAYGQTHVLGVSLSFEPQAMPSVSGRAVKVYRRPAGTTAWQMLGTWTTNAMGVFEITTKPHVNMEYTARFVSPDSGALTDAASGNVRVNVRQVVTASLSRTSIRSGETVSVHASVAPNHAGQLVYLQRFYSGAWRTVTYRALSGTSTVTFTFAFSHGCCAVKDHYFRVYKSADRDHTLGISPKLTLRVTS